MITREEAKDLFRLDTDAYGKPKAIMTKINKIYDSFEQHIKSLESQLSSNPLQLDCDGCEHVLNGRCANTVLCSRNSHPWKIDYYKKGKDTK